MNSYLDTALSVNALLKVATLQGRLCDIEQEKEKWMLEMELQQVKYDKQLQVQSLVITLAPGGECEGYAFGCLSVRMRNSKTIAPIDLIFVYK